MNGKVIEFPTPPLPSLIFNRGFIEKMMEEPSQSAALGAVEVRNQEKGFLAIKLETPISKDTTQSGFDLGMQLLEINQCILLHLILNFDRDHVFDVLLNLNAPVVRKVLELWNKTGDYFFFVFSSEGGMTAFHQIIGEDWHQHNYMGFIEQADHTADEYEKAVELFLKREHQTGVYLNLILQNDIDFLDLANNRFVAESV